MLRLVGRMLAFGFAFLAGLGLVASVVVHVAALAGVNLLGDGYTVMWILHGGVFVVFIPMFFAGAVESLWTRRAPFSGGRRANFLAGFLFAYVVVNFLWGMSQIKAIEAEPPPGVAKQEVAPNDPLVARMFSGHWMMFYFVSFAYFGRRALPFPHP